MGITNTGLEWHRLWHRLMRDCLSWVRARLSACCRGDSGSSGLGTGRRRHRLGLGAVEERLCRSGRSTVAGAARAAVAGGGGSSSGKLGKTRAHGHWLRWGWRKEMKSFGPPPLFK